MAVDPEYHSGGEGIVKTAGSIDWNVSNSDLTITMATVETTTTYNFDPLLKTLFPDHTGVKKSATGSFAIFWNKNNPPDQNLDPGSIVQLDINYPGSKVFHADKVIITSLSAPTGGMDNVYSNNVSWQSKGKFQFQ